MSNHSVGSEQAARHEASHAESELYDNPGAWPRKKYDLVSYQEIAKLAGISREYVYRIRKACPGEFPEPVATLTCGMIWDRADVVRFFRWYFRQHPSRGRPRRAGRAISAEETTEDGD